MSEDKTLKVWREFKPGNPQGIVTPNNVDPVWKCVATLSGYHDRTVYDVDWSKDANDLIATASADDAIRLFRKSDDAQDAQQLAHAQNNYELACARESAHAQDVNCVAWNPRREGLLASCSDDGDVKIWRVVNDG